MVRQTWNFSSVRAPTECPSSNFFFCIERSSLVENEFHAKALIFDSKFFFLPTKKRRKVDTWVHFFFWGGGGVHGLGWAGGAGGCCSFSLFVSAGWVGGCGYISNTLPHTQRTFVHTATRPDIPFGRYQTFFNHSKRLWQWKQTYNVQGEVLGPKIANLAWPAVWWGPVLLHSLLRTFANKEGKRYTYRYSRPPIYVVVKSDDSIRMLPQFFCSHAFSLFPRECQSVSNR